MQLCFKEGNSVDSFTDEFNIARLVKIVKLQSASLREVLMLMLYSFQLLVLCCRTFWVDILTFYVT